MFYLNEGNFVSYFVNKFYWNRNKLLYTKDQNMH